jgi:hypothetical protein
MDSLMKKRLSLCGWAVFLLSMTGNFLAIKDSHWKGILFLLSAALALLIIRWARAISAVDSPATSAGLPRSSGGDPGGASASQ